jgi:hypothetical protein
MLICHHSIIFLKKGLYYRRVWHFRAFNDNISYMILRDKIKIEKDFYLGFRTQDVLEG